MTSTRDSKVSPRFLSNRLSKHFFLDTLIVWTEPDGVDYALSFQDPEGCSEVWNFILEVQRHMNSGGALSSTHSPTSSSGQTLLDDQSTITSSPQLGSEPTSVTTAGIIRSGHLPQPELGIISEIERAIKTLARTQSVKERICEYIQQEVSIDLYNFFPYGRPSGRVMPPCSLSLYTLDS